MSTQRADATGSLQGNMKAVGEHEFSEKALVPTLYGFHGSVSHVTRGEGQT